MEQTDLILKLERIERYTLLAAKNVLDLDDLEILTGLSKSHLYKLTCTHKIPYYKPNGKLIYFNRPEIEEWMLQNRVATEEEIDHAAASYMLKKHGRPGIKL